MKMNTILATQRLIKKTRKFAATAFITLLYTVPFPLAAQLKVITTSADLASIAREVGGDLIRVQSLARGDDNLHYLSARPDYILKVNSANVFLLIGADLEVGWVPLVLKKSRNPQIQAGGRGYCDVSKGVRILGKRKGEINRQMGDVHAYGNPHYWIDPLNGIRMAKYIASCLSQIDYAHRSQYTKNYNAFRQKAITLTKRLLSQMKPHFGKSVVTYHNEFIYLTKRFRLRLAAHIEEKPGVSPGPARIRYIKNFIIKNKIKVILNTPWSNTGLTRDVARKSGARLLVLPIQTGSLPNTADYLQMIERCVELLIKALSN